MATKDYTAEQWAANRAAGLKTVYARTQWVVACPSVNAFAPIFIINDEEKCECGADISKSGTHA